MSRERWEAKASDVPGGRITRSLKQGLAGLSKEDRAAVVEKRADALDRLRAAAGAAPTVQDRDKIWALLPAIGTGPDQPSWEEILSARNYREFLSLAMRSERKAEETSDGAARTSSELRTVRQSIDEYLAFKEGFGANTYKNSYSVLTRAKNAPDPKNPGGEERTFGDRRVAGVTRTDGDALVPSLATIPKPLPSTLHDYRKHLHAWYRWELTKEAERAEEQQRQPAYTLNPFTERRKRYSSPNKERHRPVAEQEHGRRFFHGEATAIIEAAGIRVGTAYLTDYKLGLRPGELTHLRWMTDLSPLENGNGYRVDIQGGESRGMDDRCGCPSCGTPEGWAPKNRSRTYYLDRDLDEIGWITDLCDALDRWVIIRDPAPGDFVFPSSTDNHSAWTDKDLNDKLHATAKKLRETGEFPSLKTGIHSERKLTMHSWRHSCASRMLELGVPMPLVADWIGDDLETFRKVYARPDPKDIARATLAGYGPTQASE